MGGLRSLESIAVKECVHSEDGGEVAELREEAERPAGVSRIAPDAAAQLGDEEET